MIDHADPAPTEQPESQSEEAFSHARMRGYWLAAAIILSCIPLDLLLVGSWRLESALVRLVWALAFVAGALLYPRLLESRRSYLDGALAGWSGLCFTALVLALGGAGSPMYAWHLGLPLAIGAMVRPSVHTTCIVSAFSLLSTVVIGALSLDLRELGIWTALVLVASAAAIHSAHHNGRVRAFERKAHQEKLELQRQLAESQRRRGAAERLAMIGRLSAGVAHEINNPLSYVSANLTFVKDELRRNAPGINGELESALGDSLEGVRRIRTIVDDLRDFARETPERVEACHVGTLVGEALRISQARVRHIAIHTDVSDDLPAVGAIHNRLVQVLINLVVNAADALEETRPAQPTLSIRALRRHDVVVLDIEDNGPGIPKDVLPQLFAPFFTTKAPGKGTGLGLALSREYLERFGASISVDHAPGPGARFTLSLPLAQADERPTLAEVQARRPVTVSIAENHPAETTRLGRYERFGPG